MWATNNKELRQKTQFAGPGEDFQRAVEDPWHRTGAYATSKSEPPRPPREMRDPGLRVTFDPTMDPMTSEVSASSLKLALERPR